MIPDIIEDSVDLWRQVASAVEYIAMVERSGFSVWNAIADAIAVWIEDDSFGDADVREGWGEVVGARPETAAPSSPRPAANIALVITARGPNPMSSPRTRRSTTRMTSHAPNAPSAARMPCAYGAHGERRPPA